MCYHVTLFIRKLAFISDRKSVFVTESPNGQEMGVFAFELHLILIIQETLTKRFQHSSIHLEISSFIKTNRDNSLFYHEEHCQRKGTHAFR